MFTLNLYNLIKMKFLKQLAYAALTILALNSCTKNDDTPEQVSENKVDAYIQFDHVFGSDEFTLNKNYKSDNNGVLNITTLKYIVTDIVLHGTEGTNDVALSTQESFHIVDQSCAFTSKKYLTNIPNGKYNKVTFRYGVSDKIQNSGTDAQGDMLVAAKAAGLNWGWTLGYRFMTYEGSSSAKGDVFKVHNGSTGAIEKNTHTSKVNKESPSHTGGGHGHTTGGRVDNSQLIELDFSDKGAILVSDKTSPKIHLKVDIAKVLSSKNTLDVSKGDIVVDAHKSAKVAQNVATMFSVAHIHPTDINFDVPKTEDCKDTSNPNEAGGHQHSGEKKEHSHS